MIKTIILAICICIVPSFSSTTEIIESDKINIQLLQSSEIYESTSEEFKLISLSIPIDSYSIKNSYMDDKIIANNFERFNEPGEHYLTSRIFSIALPPTSLFINISYDLGECKILPDKYNIFSTQNDIDKIESIKFNQELKEINMSNVQSIYNNQSYSNEIVSFKSISWYREYKLVDIQVSPFIFTPFSNTTKYYPNITVNITYRFEQDENDNPINYHNSKYDPIADKIIINYNQAKEWYTTIKSSIFDKYDYVIITLDSLIGAIQPLVQWEIEKGRSVKVITLSWITQFYQGFDTAEKIRNFLRDKYPDSKWGIKDVCIIGHWDDIPIRKVNQIGNPVENFPETDFYYAELSLPDNQSWDLDSDHLYGEDNDTNDFYSEVNVGRIPWSDYETVQHICEKSVLYEQNTDPSFKNNILLLAAIIYTNTDGAELTEYCTNVTINPWMAHWIKTKLYEEGSEYPTDQILNHENVLTTWSTGKFSFVSWNAHGSPWGSYVGSEPIILTDDCSILNDEYPAIISSAGCHNSNTDHLNLGQAMMKQGAVGFLGANKMSYFMPNWKHPNNGGVSTFIYFFNSAVTSGNFTQGQAHQYALTKMYQYGLWFNTLKYQTFIYGSLWGNPNLGMGSTVISNPPMTPEIPTGSTSGRIRKEQQYSTVTNDPDTNDLYYCWNWGDGEIEWLGPFESGEEIEVSHRWTEKGNYEIKVKAKDVYVAESEWSDPLTVSMSKNNFKYSILNFQDNHSYIFTFLKQLFNDNEGILK